MTRIRTHGYKNYQNTSSYEVVLDVWSWVEKSGETQECDAFYLFTRCEHVGAHNFLKKNGFLEIKSSFYPIYHTPKNTRGAIKGDFCELELNLERESKENTRIHLLNVRNLDSFSSSWFGWWKFTTIWNLKGESKNVRWNWYFQVLK